MDEHGWTRIDKRAWAKPFGLDYLLLYWRGEWCASHCGSIETARTADRAIQKVASQSEPLPVDLTPPDTLPRIPAPDAEDSERDDSHDDRPVMAWWASGDGWWYVSPTTGTADRVGATPHPTALAKAMGWRAVEVTDVD